MGLKQIVKKCIVKIFPRKYIVFESVPDMGDNSKAVFDEMLRRQLNKKYTLVWLVKENLIQYPTIKNVVYVTPKDKKRKWYITRAKCFICCNAFVYSDEPSQKTFFLTHGMYVKRPTNYYRLPECVQYCLSSSEQMKHLQATALGTDVKKMFALGYPRNDVLTTAKRDLNEIFGGIYQRFIVWYPTFRQHTSGMKTGSVHSLPIVWDEKAAIRLNEVAKETNTLIVLKPHFAQDISEIKSMNLDYMRFIDDKFFVEHNITSYEFIASCDAMLTDYSSVYFDYTLCDKPIGLIWEDYEEYSQDPGFALDMVFFMKGGVKIYNVEEFIAFIQSVARGEDILATQRREIRDISNYSTDGHSTQRVTDYIIKEAKL